MKKSFLATLFFITTVSLNAQIESSPMFFGASSNAPSPTSAGLGKYGDIPVSLYTGVPEISIPLYTISEGNLSVPISLSYHSQGFKVEEMASWVGLGWSLNAGGVITRAVKGAPDDFNNNYWWGTDLSNNMGLEGISTGFLSTGQNVQNWKNSNPFPNVEQLLMLAGNQIDGQPDIFYVNFPGGAGQFMFDNAGVPRFLSQTNFKTTYQRDVNGNITKFEVIDGNGNIYIFDQIETTQITDVRSSSQAMMYYTGGGQLTDDNVKALITSSAQGFNDLSTIKSQYNSSWYLSKIKNATGNHEINLSYMDEQQVTKVGFSFKFESNSDAPYTSYSLDLKPIHSISVNNNKRLSQISSTNSKVVFEANHIRLDANDYSTYNTEFYNITPQCNALTGIIFKDYADNIIKRYNINYNYFLANGYANAGSYSSFYRKLKLTSVSEQNNNATLTNPSYLFEYDETFALAPRFSQQQDWWGFPKSNTAVAAPLIYFYPNDPVDNDFLSEFSVYPRTSHNGQITLGYYDRACDINTVKTGLLKKITYPTKGTTSFEYEPHQFYLMGQNRNGGGVRIKKITDFDGIDHSKDIIKNYSYQQVANSSLTSGKALTMPVFANRRLCTSIYHVDIFNNSMSPLGTTMGSLVGYGEVTTEFNGNGKTLNKFNQQASVGVEVEDCVNNDCVYYRTHTGLAYHYGTYVAAYGGGTACYSKSYFPFPDNPNYDWKRGTLLEEYVYDNQNRLLKKTINEYTTKNYQKISAFVCKPLAVVNVGDDNGSYPDYALGYAAYYYLSGWNVLSKQTITRYDVNSAASVLTSINNMVYANPTHKQLTATYSIDNNGLTHYTKYNRSLDVTAGTSGTPFCNTLTSQNRLNELIQKIEYTTTNVADINTYKTLGASFTEYKDFKTQNGLTNSQLLPFKTYRLETATPLAYTTTNDGNFGDVLVPYGTYYKQLAEYNYDNKDNLSRKSAINGNLKINSANIYGHSKNLIIAQVNNATETDCGFTSFESDDQNLWENAANFNLNTDARTGTKSCNVLPNTFGPTRNYTPSADFQNKKFILSCWVKTNAATGGNIGSLVLYTIQNTTGNAINPNVSGSYVVKNLTNTNNIWNYVEVEIDLKQIKTTAGLPLTTNIGIRSFVQNTNTTTTIQVDDIRFYPKEARMSSYTYIPSVGASSITDENNTSQYFEYDTFGRLKLVKDQEGSIIEKTDYNYKP